MTYVPPRGEAIVFSLSAGYTPPPIGAINVVWQDDSGNRARTIRVVVSASFGGATSPPSVLTAARWGDLSDVVVSLAAAWSDSRDIQRGVPAAWIRSPPADAALQSMEWRDARPSSASSISVRHARTLARDRAAQDAWRVASPLFLRALWLTWLQSFARDRVIAQAWTPAQLPLLRVRIQDAVTYTPPAGDAIAFLLRGGYSPPAGMDIALVVARAEAIDVDHIRTDPSAWRVPWGTSPTDDARADIRWGRGPQYHRPDPPPTDSGWTGSPGEPPPIPLASRVYIVMNDVSVVRLPDGTPIDVVAVDLNASVDAWCWSVRMELADPSQVTLLKPDGNGPKLVQITMNGYVWTALIEGRESSRAHADESITVTGRSQTALLSNAYIAARSAAFVDPQSAQQLALREITDRALPFTLQWSGLDWVVPGGAWYYQDMTPIDVIAQIAASRGAVLQSAPADAQLIVQSRYPVSPWAWSAGAADVALPSAWMADVSAQQQSKPLYDAVVIAGQAQGVLARITRAGQAGETFASQVVDQLIVTPDVAVERGRNILADRGVQELMTCNVPLFPTGTITAGMSGLYAPLLLVDVQDSADPYQAQSVGVTVSARRAGNDNKALEIWQRIELERHLTDAH